MIDHVTLHVSNIERSKAFYLAALAPLGYKMMMDYGKAVGFGATNPDLWLSEKEDAKATHIALAADSTQTVDEFHKAALAAGGKDNGAPGIRADYSPTYYAAYMHDPDGNNIEVVCDKEQ